MFNHFVSIVSSLAFRALDLSRLAPRSDGQLQSRSCGKPPLICLSASSSSAFQLGSLLLLLLPIPLPPHSLTRESDCSRWETPTPEIYSFFKTLTDQVITVELKNDLSITGTLKSVDQSVAQLSPLSASSLQTLIEGCDRDSTAGAQSEF